MFQWADTKSCKIIGEGILKTKLPILTLTLPKLGDKLPQASHEEVMDCLAEPGHRITLLAAHDNMMTAFLIALGIYKEQWPLYASSVLHPDRTVGRCFTLSFEGWRGGTLFCSVASAVEMRG